MAARSSSYESNVNFDMDHDGFDDQIYFEESEDDVQEIGVVLGDVNQPGVAPHCSGDGRR